MKKFVLFFVVCILFASFSFAQKTKDTLKLTTLEFVSGKGAVASGLYGYATFENKKSSVMLTLSAEDLEVTYLRKISNTLSIGPNV